MAQLRNFKFFLDNDSVHKVIYLLDYLHCTSNLRYATWVVRDNKIYGYLEVFRPTRVTEKMKQHGIVFSKREDIALNTVEALCDLPYSHKYTIGERASFQSRGRQLKDTTVYVEEYQVKRRYTDIAGSLTTSPMPAQERPNTTSICECPSEEEVHTLNQ